jgi:Alpha-N-acetylglucosaminidase (NAGLU) C-terminal domain
MLQTNDFFLPGRWLQFVPAWASSPAELVQLNFDVRSNLTAWGDRKASEFGLHEYGNRDWAGLAADYYRWKIFFCHASGVARFEVAAEAQRLLCLWRCVESEDRQSTLRPLRATAMLPRWRSRPI